MQSKSGAIARSVACPLRIKAVQRSILAYGTLFCGEFTLPLIQEQTSNIQGPGSAKNNAAYPKHQEEVETHSNRNNM